MIKLFAIFGVEYINAEGKESTAFQETGLHLNRPTR